MQLLLGDCVASMKTLPENSVDSIVTDPPYELGFMGKSWDNTGIANSIEMWTEALRVLKPGGHLLAFSGSRTYHRMACAIEDAGFEIRDQIMWVYGSGFPKSHNVANGIDKLHGAKNRGHAISSGSQIHPTTGLKRANGELLDKYEARTKEGTGWEGWGTALKPAHEPIVLARKPFPKGYTVAKNVLEFGVGGLNIDGTRVGADDARSPSSKTSFGLINDDSWKAQEVMAGSASGRFPANFIHDGSDEVVALFPEAGNKWKRNYGSEDYEGRQYDGGSFGGGGYNGQNTYADSGSAARFFYCAKTSKRDRNEGLEGFEEKNNSKMMRNGNNTSEVASKGFDRFQGTPSSNNHPTVKPTDLMRYLCRLITPPNGIILDPFMGSGSTGKAAVLEGFDFIGCEMESDYIEIARARIEFAINVPDDYSIQEETEESESEPSNQLTDTLF